MPDSRHSHHHRRYVGLTANLKQRLTDHKEAIDSGASRGSNKHFAKQVPQWRRRPRWRVCFLNRRGGSLTRFGVRYLLRKYLPDYLSPARRKKIHPNSLRHTTAIHLLKASVDFATIRQWSLVHLSSSLNVTTYGEASSSRRDGASSVLPAWTRQGFYAASAMPRCTLRVSVIGCHRDETTPGQRSSLLLP